MKTPKPEILVVGSINMDLVIECGRIPAPGETLLAKSATEFCGGKGANQAVSAARSGGNVTMVGAVGDDAFASRLRSNLQVHQIDDAAVQSFARTASGLAVINVDSHGQNSIVVVPGANGLVHEEHLSAVSKSWSKFDAVLLQLEIPLNTVLEAARKAREAGVRVIFDPAPAPQLQNLPDEFFDVDLMCPNETEASALTGMPVGSVEDAQAAAAVLQDRGVRNVAITMGSRGTWLATQESQNLIPPFAVDPVDTTAAGDAWAGAFAVFWSETGDASTAVRFANAAGALAASERGAQASLASREKVELMLQKFG